MRTYMIVLSCVALTTHAAAQDWPTGVGGNPARDGLSSVTGPSGPDLLWQGSRSAIVAQQSVASDGLLVSSRIGSFTIPTGTWIVAQDLATGIEQWAVQLPYDFPGSSWRSRVSAFHDGQVYASRAGNTNLDYLYALSPADGSIIWRSEGLVDEGSTESLAFTSDGDLIAGNFGSVMRIDRDDGTTVWSSPRSCPTSNGCEAAVFNDRVYLFEANAGGPIISVFDGATGTKLYSSAGIVGGFVQQVGPFVGPDGTVYAPRTQNNPLTDFLVAFTDTGTALVEKWSTPIGYVPFASFGVGPDGSVYSYLTTRDGGNADLTIVRIDPVNGTVTHTSSPVPSNFPVQPRMAIGADGIVYMTNGGFSNGSLTSFDADLTQRWTTPVTNVNVGGPLLAGNGILVICGVGSDVRAYQTPCTADWNDDGLVNTSDVLAYLNDYNTVRTGGTPVFGDPDLAAPIGVLNTADVLAYLNAFASGC